MDNQPKHKPQLQPQTQLRLNKFLAERLGVSRREADELIAAGKITINGRVATIGEKIALSRKREKTNFNSFSERRREDNISEGNVDKNPKVCYNGKIIPFETVFLYLAFNKPIGYVCSRRAQGSSPTIYKLLPKKYHHLKTVGRLDKDSSGLILLTNDGDFAFKMTHPKFRKNKVYEVELDKPLEPLHQQMISDYGVTLEDGPSRFKVLSNDLMMSLSKGVRSAAARGIAREPRGDGSERRAPRKTTSLNRYMVILSEGRNRQIRRTFAALGYNVTKLHRTSFGKFELNDLKPGKYVIIKP